MSYVIPVVCLLPVMAILYGGWDDVEKKSRAFKLTVEGGEGWKPERKKVRSTHRAEKTEE